MNNNICIVKMIQVYGPEGVHRDMVLLRKHLSRRRPDRGGGKGLENVILLFSILFTCLLQKNPEFEAVYTVADECFFRLVLSM